MGRTHRRNRKGQSQARHHGLTPPASPLSFRARRTRGEDSKHFSPHFHHEQSPHHRCRRSRQCRCPQVRHAARGLRRNHPRLSHTLEVRHDRRLNQTTHRPHDPHRASRCRQLRRNRRADPQDRRQVADQCRAALPGPPPHGCLPRRRLRLHGHGKLRAQGCREI